MSKNCLMKVKYTGYTKNMQTHLQGHQPDLLAEKAANVNESSQPADMGLFARTSL